MEAMVNNICDIVLKRLHMPRVGILWTSGNHDFLRWAPSGELTWVHYLSGDFTKSSNHANNPCYIVESLTDPYREAKTLSALIIPNISLDFVSKLCLGLPFTAAGSLVFGCLDEQLPVIVDDTCITRWLRTIDPKRIDEITSRLCNLGFIVISKIGSTNSSRVLELDEKGWISWCEIADRLSGIGVVILKNGSRLTGEAEDRLRSLGIKIER